MVALSAEIADGLVFANASRAHMTESLGALPAAKRSEPDFFIGNRIRTCISDDVDNAKAVLRKTIAGTVKLRRSSQNTGARGLSSCRVGRAAPLRRRF
jgi:alkanesulfonate monooxygenase SsuD/methylene tetrahydromethanopterin reductase-like flavin-dependent oxidoreductase (luciferase family)